MYRGGTKGGCGHERQTLLYILAYRLNGEGGFLYKEPYKYLLS